MVVANSLLQNPLWINLYSFKQMLYSFISFLVGEDRLYSVQVMQGDQWCHWVRSQQTKYIAMKINLVLPLKQSHKPN